MCTLTINTTVLIIDHQAHQGGLKREDKERVGEHLTNTQSSPLGKSLTHDLGCSLGYPLTEEVVKTTCDLFFCSDMQLDIHDVSATLLLCKTADSNFQTTFIQCEEIT